jgi:hypothetical protein
MCESDVSLIGIFEFRSFSDGRKYEEDGIKRLDVPNQENLKLFLKNADLNHLRKKNKKIWKGSGDARAATDGRRIATTRSKINGGIVRYFSEPLYVRQTVRCRET